MEMREAYTMVSSLFLLVLGFVLLVKGADFFVDGASAVARRFGIPQLVIGLTIVAMGTSAPEAAVSITAAVRGNADITIGNIVGSNILNILIILGLSSVVAPLAVTAPTLFRDIPFMIGITLLLLFQGTGGSVGFWEGAVLTLLFLAYLGYLLWAAQKDGVPVGKGMDASRKAAIGKVASGKAASEKECGTAQNTGNADVPGEKYSQKSRERGGNSGQTAGMPKPDGKELAAASAEGKKPLLWTALLGTAAGLIMIVAGSHTAVDAATDLARLFGMSERFIGLTIVALGTSLPELFTSVSAAAKGNADIAIGNIVGSNIFNILFVVGVSALITPVPFSAEFYADMWIAAAAGVLLLVCSVKGRKLGRRGGIAMLAGYVLYFVFICL